MRLPVDHVARLLLESSERSGPLHRRLSDSLRELIQLGELPAGASLPSERAMAEALYVSRTTVVAAYETLRQEGLVDRRQGSGTRVKARRGEGRETVSSPALAGHHAGAQFLRGPVATVDFTMAAMPCLPLVPKVAASFSESNYEALAMEQPGYHPAGLAQLRNQIASTYTQAGLPTSAEQILVTSGAQQALELIAHGCLQLGDEVVTGSPTYRGALEAFGMGGSRLRSVPCDDFGLDVDRLELSISNRPPRLIYVQSTVDNPTGSVMADDRRQRLAQLAERNHVIVVDDSSLEGTLFEGPRPPLLAQLTSADRVLTVGSMSKLYWGGLRVGWIRGDSMAISRLAQMKGITDLGTSLVSQMIAVHLLERLEEARAARREQLTAGLQDLTTLLTRHLPDWSWILPRGGASLWVRVPTHSLTDFAHVARQYGVAILPGTVFSPDAANDDHTRLPYALPRSTLSAGIQRLSQAWHAYASGDRTLPIDLATT